MGKGWGPGAAGAVYTDRSYHSTAPGPYGLPPTGQPNTACKCASGAPSSACELRWTLGMVADVEAMMAHLLSAAAVGLAPATLPAFACNTSQ